MRYKNGYDIVVIRFTRNSIKYGGNTVKVKKISKKIAIMLSAAAITTSLGAVTAFANESWDSTWEVSSWATFNGGRETILTNIRNKTDTTSAYGNVLSGNSGGATGNSYVSMQLKDENGNDLWRKQGDYRVLPPVIFRGNVEHYVPSNAYENGYTKVRMSITQDCDWFNRGCNGKWSSDSY